MQENALLPTQRLLSRVTYTPSIMWGSADGTWEKGTVRTAGKVRDVFERCQLIRIAQH